MQKATWFAGGVLTMLGLALLAGQVSPPPAAPMHLHVTSSQDGRTVHVWQVVTEAGEPVRQNRGWRWPRMLIRYLGSCSTGQGVTVNEFVADDQGRRVISEEPDELDGRVKR